MMLEFLKECGPNELYERAKDCELNLKSFNPYTPMASLFETTLKTEFYKYFPYERFNKKIDPSLLDLLANDDFTDKYTQDFFFDKKSLEVIDKIRKESNRFKHRDSQKTRPGENDVRDCFKCLYSFCTGIYKASMCKPAPAWSDSEYDKLIRNLLDNDKRLEEIDILKNQVISLSSKVDASNSERNNAYAIAEELREEMAREREKYADKDELEKIKNEKNELSDKLTDLKHKLAKSENDKGNLKIERDRVERELKSSNREAVNRISQEKSKLEKSYNNLCLKCNQTETENSKLKEEISAYEIKLDNLMKRYEKACSSADNLENVIKIKEQLNKLQSEILRQNDENKKLILELNSKRSALSKISSSYSNDTEMFKDAAVRSATQYYRYLDKYATQTGTGFTSQIVSSISRSSNVNPNRYWIYVSKLPYNLEAMLIKIDDTVYTPEDIKPIEIDRDNSRINVELSKDVVNQLGNNFEKIEINRVFVLSDMKFLVSRVGKWYKTFGNNLHLPEYIEPVPEADFSLLKDNPSKDQEEALHGILTQPFSYVWGAPGTGKTQFVLARAVLSYIQAGKKVLVTAPTNNAVEQTLYGLLNVLGNAGVDYNKLVVRCGTASSKFAQLYPGVCENAEYSSRLMELQESINSKEAELKSVEETITAIHDYEIIKRDSTAFENTASVCRTFFSDLSNIAEKINDKVRLDNEYSELIRVNNSNIEVFRKEKSALEIKVPKIRKKLDSKSLGIRLGFVNAEQLNSELLELLRKINEYDELIKYTNAEIIETNTKIAEEEKKYELNVTAYNELKVKLFDAIKGNSDFTEITEGLNPKNTSNTLNKINEYINSVCLEFNESLAKYTYLEEKNISDYEHEKVKISKQINEYLQEKETVIKKIDEKNTSICKVFACTIDNCISRFLPNDISNQFAHVFLDEAAYASLIKGAVLFSYGCPVTFLGDHMQLPPVCELDDDIARAEKEYDMVPLWSQSALFAEDIFNYSPNEIISDYLDLDPNKQNVPKCRNMVKYDLTNSHRFGNELAHVLAGPVYSKSFRGSDEANTRLYYIDAKRIHGKEKRQNQGEGLAIVTYVKENTHFKNISKESDSVLGIISPYKNQSKLISSYFVNNKKIRDSVMNVHRSQGREWDTVIFSTTDKDDKFFSDSNKMIGKQIINTAVSRVKKNLIIVCDYDYWINQKGQLICELLKVAEKIEINIPYEEAVNYPDPALTQKPTGIDSRRLLRAKNMIVNSKNGMYIISGGNSSHIVKRKGNGYECDCQDYMDGTKYCKHILAVMLKNGDITT